MKWAMTSRDRRALAAGLLVVVPAVLYAGAIRPAAAHLEGVRARTQAQQDLLGREMALLEAAHGYPERMDELEHEVPEGARRLFTGTDEVAATASLAAHLGEAARVARMHVEQVEHRPAEPWGEGLLELRVAFRGAGDLQGLLTFLHRAQAGPLVVRLETISIEARDRGAGQDDSEELWLTASARAYTLAPPAATIDGGEGEP